MHSTERSAHGNAATAHVLKSTSIIGGSSLVNVLFKVLQVKTIALLLGPTGVGLIGLFNSAAGLASTVSGMGVATSSVPGIVEVITTGDQQATAESVETYRFGSLRLI